MSWNTRGLLTALAIGYITNSELEAPDSFIFHNFPLLTCPPWLLVL